MERSGEAASLLRPGLGLNSVSQRFEPLRVAGLFGLPQLPASKKHISEQRIRHRSFLNLGKEGREVAFQQVLQQTARDGIPQVFLGMTAPSSNERPDGLRVRFDEILDLKDRLPPGVLALLDRLAG
jgi:hypothetical protein